MRLDRCSDELHNPIDRGFFFIAPHASYERRTTDLYNESRRIASYDVTSILAGIDIGSQFTRYGELRIGMLGGVLSPELDTGPQSLSPGDDNVTQGAFSTRLFLDQLDSVQFPRSGWSAGLNMFNSSSLLGADQESGTAMDPSSVHSVRIRSTSVRKLVVESAPIHCRVMTCSSGVILCSSRATRLVS